MAWAGSSRRSAVTAPALYPTLRRYGDRSYRYGVGAVAREDDDLAGLYGEEQLVPTGRRVGLEIFSAPGLFSARDVVVVSPSYPDREAAGEQGEVQGWSCDSEGVRYAVWVPSRELVWLVDQRALIATGRCVPSPDRTQPVTSLQVSQAGEVLGAEEYVIVEDIDDLL
jgi:hypothetical protein